MPLMKLRGEQLKTGIITNSHLAEKILEANLDINWAGYYNAALESKKVVDFVQLNGINVPANASVVDLTALGKIAGTEAKAGSNELSVEGIIIDSPKNKVTVRNAADGEPILAPNNSEVYGRLVYDEGNSAFKLQLVYLDGANEVAYTPASAVTIDIQYARRFNLRMVDELFAANEKFVDGAADTTAYLNIVQLAKDLYGSGYSLDRDGNANLQKSVLEQLADEIARATAAEDNLQDAIDAEELARQQAITGLLADLASNEAGKGASLIGIADAGGKFTATTVEGALAELKAAIDAVIGGGEEGLSLNSLDQRLDAVEAEIQTARGSFTALSDRLADIESDIANETSARQAADSALDGRVSALETEVQDARGEYANLDARLDAIDSAISAEAAARASAISAVQSDIATLDSRVDTLEGDQLVFFKYTVTITEQSSVVNVPQDKPAFNAGNSSLCIFLNGVLQEEGVNYAELTGGTGVDFTPDVLQVGDKVTFWYYKKASQLG